MHEYYPLLLTGAIIGTVTTILVFAYIFMKDKKEAFGFERTVKDGDLFKFLWTYVKPLKKHFIAALCIMVFSICYDVIAPSVISQIEGYLKEDFELSTLFRMVVLYASLLVVSVVSSYFQALILQKAGQRMVSNIRQDLYIHIEGLSHEELNSIPVGTLVTRVSNDPGAISQMFTGLLVNLVKNCFIIVGVLIAMLCVNYELTLMVLCFVPFVVLFTYIFRKFSRRAFRRVKDETTGINIFLSEHLSGMKIIQVFNREQRKMREFNARNEKLGRAKQAQIVVFGIFRPLVYMLYISSILCLFYLSGKGYLDNSTFMGQTIASETIVAFYLYINKFYNPIQNLAEQFHRLQATMASTEKIYHIFEIQPTVVDEPDAIELESVQGDIEFRNVWFSYIENEWVLKGVSFHIKPQQTVAFVGATGSGKTTILSLICRNYNIQKGQILIDGIDIRHIKISSLRRHFGQMLQDVFLFSGTIRSNIVLQGTFTDEEVKEACDYVNASHFINRLPHGIYEEVRERGNNFSAGERQLLSFARTVIHKPEVMILDEATANIDTETEILIQDSLEKMMNVSTMLIVAHRLSTIQHADNIIVLSHGEILEEGTHQELLSHHGRYFELYSLQFEKERLQRGEKTRNLNEQI